MFAIMYVAIFAIVGAVVYFVLTYKLGLIDKILGKKMINKILNKVTLGKVKIKDDGNDNQED
jgi:hypothetical protein